MLKKFTNMTRDPLAVQRMRKVDVCVDVIIKCVVVAT